MRARIEATGVEGLRYDFDVDTFGEASEMPADDPWVKQVGRGGAGRRRQPGIIGMSFTTDARFVRNQAGIPTVVCGPGAVEQAHVNDEWVAVDRLVDATTAYADCSPPWLTARLGLPAQGRDDPWTGVRASGRIVPTG